MSERQDFIALDWVAGEIEETLKQASHALDAYLANRDDVTKLRFCLTHIHQVHGTLQMVEFFGAALLADEMEVLAKNLIDGVIQENYIEDALAVLKSAIAQLPLYLERVKASRHGLPAVLLPVLNDLRSVRGDSLLSETALFSPDLAAVSAVDESAIVTISASELRDVSHKLRQMFQIALLGLIRDREVKKNLNYLAKVCARLTKLTEGYAVQPLWRICIAVLEGLLNGTIESSVAVKTLLRHVDRQIKNIIDQGEFILGQSPPEDLLKNLLYYVARSKANSRYIKEIQSEYNLGSSLLGESELDDDSLATPDSATIEVVVQALAKELEDIQLALTGVGTNHEGLAGVLQMFRRVSDTMAILGMGAALKQLQEPYTHLSKVLVAQDDIDNTELQTIVTQVVQITRDLNANEAIDKVTEERGLFNDSEEAQQHLDRAFDSVVTESRLGLEQAKDAIVEYVATQWDKNRLTDLPNLLASIRGSLIMVPLTKAANLLGSCENFVNEKLLQSESTPEWQMLDTLADAITSVDYYLERLVDDVNIEGDSILDVAAESVARLGYPINDQVVDLAPDISSGSAVEEQDVAGTATKDSSINEDLSSSEVIEHKAETSVDSDNAEEEDSDIDPEILEIFIEESEEVLDTIIEFLPQWQANTEDEEASATIRRAFHTLKGSGRMVGATDIGEVAWSIENMLNRVLDGSIKIDTIRFELMAEVKDHMPALVKAFEFGNAIDKALVENIIGRASLLAEQQNPSLEEFSGAEIANENIRNIKTETETETETEALEIDTELLDIFRAEAGGHCQAWEDFIAHSKELAGPAELTDELQRALHTLKGSAHMAGVTPVAEISTPIEKIVKDLRASQLKIDEPLLAMLEKGLLFIRAGIEQLDVAPFQTLPGADLFIAEFVALFEERMALVAEEGVKDSGIAPEALNQFLTDSLDLIMDISGRLVLWQQQLAEPSDFSQFEPSMQAFIGQAKSVGMQAPAELGQSVHQFYQKGIAADFVGDDFFELANAANDCLIDMLDQIAGHQTPDFDSALIDQITAFEFTQLENLNDSHQFETEVASTEVDAVEFSQDEDEDRAAFNGQAAINDTDEEAVVDEVEDVSEEVDPEIIEIFIEEADELLEELEETVHGLEVERSSRNHFDELLRILHTLKGGARLAGMTQLGDVSHNFETSLMELDGDHIDIDDNIFSSIQQYQDQLVAMVNALKAGDVGSDENAKPVAADSLETIAIETEIADLEAEEPLDIVEDTQEQSIELSDDSDQSGIESYDNAEAETDNLQRDIPSADTGSKIVPFIAAKPRERSAPAAIPLDSAPGKKVSQEVVKVSAQLLEELVNLAGETSISRGRSEEQISELVFSLEEMQITVDRLQEQVRRLDMETEQQILYRQEQVESEGLEGFDPLEMDRYSQLQQLSRSLLESSSDLVDIKNTLSDKSRDMETLLIQQSRINTELQEGLMRSRMVPFARMVPRLRRIIRQIGGELNKKVDFHLDNIEGELDRTVLERMVAPLEHMLRNAVDHGIEDSAVRVAAGKPSRGNVALELSREGGEIVITLTDDGAGIDLGAIKTKAIERGLMEPHADLSEREILQFILLAGFSTASEITQISGRGVGMDVVNSEIKQLGGSMEIESRLGKGSRFIVRLPFTVSVNRALMVSCGGDSYAIPLNSIEGIVRVSPFELEAYYEPDAPMFEYAGQPYLFHYMGGLLQRGEKPILEGHTTPLPVLLVRGAEHSVAVQVDSLMGSREIVVKPLGPQFSTVQGLTGATVLGDGSVVVILDLLAMIRADTTQQHRDVAMSREEYTDEERAALVMVVDDSVTVRKVTSRLLERQGMKVLLAKDGVDAVSQLQDIERVPDVMLLDIEMPRMDGFEVASRVRHNSRLKGMPIIMITSRTGEKHRERAFSLGVNEYMGKPYQELELLETINSLVKESMH